MNIRTTAISVLLLASLVACVGAAPKRQATVIDKVKLSPGDSRKLVINANQSWRNTGITVAPGEVYQLTAAGAWSNGTLLCGFSDADGIGANRVCRQDPLKLGLLGHALIGRIGDKGKAFHVGKKLRLTAKSEGALQLWDYDHPSWIGDNTGKMTVTIARVNTSATTLTSPTPVKFSSQPIKAKFKTRATNANAIAVIIGNANYAKQGRDIPDVLPAYADAASFKQFALTQLGIKPGNIIEFKDATRNQMQRIFGSRENHRGQLFDWVRAGKSEVYFYYAGHGAPAGKKARAYLVPADADASRLELNGYALDIIYRNLAKLPAKKITVILEACFSGNSPGGSVFAKASGIYVTPNIPEPARKITVISAGGADQMASWERDQSHSLFTKYYLLGMAGEADKQPTGNQDGKVTRKELQAYLRETMSYYARRYYGRDQVAQIRNQ